MKQYIWGSLSSPVMLQLVKTFNKHYIHVLNCSVPAATTEMEILTVPLLPMDLPLNDDCRKSCGKIHQASCSTFAYCKRSKTGGREGLRTRLQYLCYQQIYASMTAGIKGARTTNQPRVLPDSSNNGLSLMRGFTRGRGSIWVAGTYCDSFEPCMLTYLQVFCKLPQLQSMLCLTDDLNSDCSQTGKFWRASSK